MNTPRHSIDHREFLKSLSAEQRVQLTQKTNQPAFVRLASILCLHAIAIACIVLRIPFWPLVIVFQGILLMCLFHLMHECIHATAFASKRINRIVSVACGWFLFLPAQWFRHFHFAHHRHTQDVKNDPELALRKPGNWVEWVLHVTGVLIWFASVKLFLSALTGQNKDSFVPAESRSRVTREIRLMMCGYAAVVFVSLITQSALLFWIWILPLGAGQPFLRLYLLAEHANCPNEGNMFVNTRTVFTHPVIRWLTWNMPYHTEHHVYPAAPFHKLPLLHQYMKKNLINTNNGYVEFNQTYTAAFKKS